MNVVKSISYENEDIIKSIIDLHLGGTPIECDVTYSKGLFYKGIEHPRLKFDLCPQTEDTIMADCRNLPLNDCSISSIMFDPPFVISKGPSMKEDKNGQNIISKRFSYFENPKELFEFYKEALKEIYRVLKDGGVLIFKCQDTVSSGNQYISHCNIYNYAIEQGFYPKDLFVLNAKQRIISGKHKNQKHSRKYHSYFWVFVKNDKKIKAIKRFV